jgi:hypothetical protein
MKFFGGIAAARVIIFFLLPATIAVCAGQGPNHGSISGRVLTAAGNGESVPGAPVEATNLDTKETYKTTSASDGGYMLNGLPPGNYEISVERFFLFLRFHQSGVQVAFGKTTRLDIRLDDFNLGTLGDGGVDFAQALKEQPAPSGPSPRASDGKPDLSGMWRGGALPSLIGEAPDPLPWADAIAKKPPNPLSGTAICLPGGIPTEGIAEYQLVQTLALIVILDGGFNPTRLIYLDGRGHPKDFNPSWMGHSIGHWEGDTLAVETVGFNELGRLGVAGGGLAQNLPQTEKLRVTERFRRPDLGHLEVETTYDDPGAFRKPFKTRYVKSLAPKDWETSEYVCAENNRDVQHLSGK